MLTLLNAVLKMERDKILCLCHQNSNINVLLW